MSTHTMTPKFPVKFTFPGFDGYETADIELEITFIFTPGLRAAQPTFEHGGLPAEPPQIELVKARFISGDGISPGAGGQKQVDFWADDYLNSEEGYEHACNVAESDQEASYWADPEPDFDEDHHSALRARDED